MFQIFFYDAKIYKKIDKSKFSINFFLKIFLDTLTFASLEHIQYHHINEKGIFKPSERITTQRWITIRVTHQKPLRDEILKNVLKCFEF